MKLRWSNEYDLAFAFEANSIETLQREGLSAMRLFRTATERRVHRGEIHKTVSWFKQATLHIRDENHDAWFGLGFIRHLDGGALSGAAFWTPSPVRLAWREANSLTDALTQDELWFITNVEHIWQLCIDTHQWGDALNLTVMKLGDDLDRHIRDGETT
jgi:hypothetical protein